MTEKIKILIADDHPVIRDGLKQIIHNAGNISIIAQASDGIKAFDLILEYKPDIALLDLSMPGMTGLQVLRELRQNKSETKVIFLTMYKEQDIFEEAMDLGAEGYVLKESAESDILDSINEVANGNYYISSHLSNLLVSRRKKIDELNRQKPELSRLTPAERRILKLIAMNKTSKDISDELFISYRTVENHRTNIINKLNLHGAHSLLNFAIENKSHI